MIDTALTPTETGRPTFRLGLPAAAILAGERYAVYTVEIPHEVSPETEARIGAIVDEGTPDGIRWLLAQGLYRRVTLAGVSRETPPARPVGDLLVDLFEGTVYRLRNARAFETGLVIEPATLTRHRH